MEHISPDAAEREYGITCNHEKMENGELRFRLTSSDGSGYIRTVSTPQSKWQKSHYHKEVKETYIVQKGWMVLASLRNGQVILEKYEKGTSVTTELLVPHNVYLPADSVIHTVKHGESQESDWLAYPDLDAETIKLTENQILANARQPLREVSVDPRFDAYIDIYNNLDNLIWRVPGFFVAALAILLGFIGNILSKPDSSLPLWAWGVLFLFVGVLFLLGSYSMGRIRFHHSRMGEELKLMEPQGYFHTRSKTVKQYWPPAAPHVFIIFFTILGLVFLILSCLAVSEYVGLTQLLKEYKAK